MTVPQPEQLTLPVQPIIIGIAGCSGSGKTTLARELATQLDATVFPLDLYYRDLSQFPLDSRDKQNFDHPDSLESELFIEHLRDLRLGRTIQRPVYDFSRHTRVPNAFEPVVPSRVIIVEGILALHYDELLPLYDFSIYVDAPNQICLKRRIYRDMRERGRTESLGPRPVRSHRQTHGRPLRPPLTNPRHHDRPRHRRARLVHRADLPRTAHAWIYSDSRCSFT